MGRPAKRARLLSDAGSDSGADGEFEGRAGDGFLKINKEYAARFEHNKKREERQRLEEKYAGAAGSDDSSSDETEDDDADLVTADLDQEIMSTLTAIKSRDPRVYDQSVNFYRPIEESGVEDSGKKKPAKDKPMTLKDYHRDNILAGFTGEVDEEMVPQTYQQEQDALRTDVVREMHAAAEDSEDESGFTVKKNGAHEQVKPVLSKRKQITSADVVAADKDPETFLSNFMAAQAWRPTAGESAAPFDSDDSEDDERADAFEQAYNMRFEDPSKANETLKSFARDAGQYSVRRDDVGGRKRARERESQAKQEAKQEREKDRDRLRKLKIGEAEEKLEAIRQAAGLAGKQADVQDWRDMLEGDFNDESWDKEMRHRFGEQYYAAADNLGDEPNEKRKKPKKPEWNDDIDVADIMGEDTENGGFQLTDDEAEASAPAKTKAGAKDQAREAKQAHKRDRRLIEQMVEASLPTTTMRQGSFRYRDTSPVSFGMRAQDILFASDAQLNQYAGLKKLAPFRDDTRKSKDKKHLGKKARLREWRKEVFGKEEPDLPSFLGEEPPAPSRKQHKGKKDDKTGSKKRKRKNKTKSA